jgi:hypothetical protein
VTSSCDWVNERFQGLPHSKRRYDGRLHYRLLESASSQPRRRFRHARLIYHAHLELSVRTNQTPQHSRIQLHDKDGSQATANIGSYTVMKACGMIPVGERTIMLLRAPEWTLLRLRDRATGIGKLMVISKSSIGLYARVG